MADDGELLLESLADPLVFDGVYRRYRAPVAAYAARRLGVDGVEDATAEVFVRAFRARATYVPVHDTALPWLLGIASRVVAEQRRGERRRLAILQRVATQGEAVVVDGERFEVDPRLVRALRRLPATDRDTLLLIAWGELSYAETATALGVPVGTIRSRVARARQRLGFAFDPEPGVARLRGQGDG